MQPRDPERVVLPGRTGLSRGQPCALRSTTGHRSRPCRSEESPLPGSRHRLPLVHSSSARVAQCPLWVPRPHGGLRPPFHLHTEMEALCPCPQGSAQEPQTKPLPCTCPTQAGHVAHGAVRASDTPVRPGSRRDRGPPPPSAGPGAGGPGCAGPGRLSLRFRGARTATVMRGPGTAAQKLPSVLAQGLERFPP